MAACVNFEDCYRVGSGKVVSYKVKWRHKDLEPLNLNGHSYGFIIQ